MGPLASLRLEVPGFNFKVLGLVQPPTSLLPLKSARCCDCYNNYSLDPQK